MDSLNLSRLSCQMTQWLLVLFLLPVYGVLSSELYLSVIRQDAAECEVSIVSQVHRLADIMVHDFHDNPASSYPRAVSELSDHERSHCQPLAFYASLIAMNMVELFSEIETEAIYPPPPFSLSEDQDQFLEEQLPTFFDSPDLAPGILMGFRFAAAYHSIGIVAAISPDLAAAKKICEILGITGDFNDRLRRLLTWKFLQDANVNSLFDSSLSIEDRAVISPILERHGEFLARIGEGEFDIARDVMQEALINQGLSTELVAEATRTLNPSNVLPDELHKPFSVPSLLEISMKASRKLLASLAPSLDGSEDDHVDSMTLLLGATAEDEAVLKTMCPDEIRRAVKLTLLTSPRQQTVQVLRGIRSLFPIDSKSEAEQEPAAEQALAVSAVTLPDPYSLARLTNSSTFVKRVLNEAQNTRAHSGKSRCLSNFLPSGIREQYDDFFEDVLPHDGGSLWNEIDGYREETIGVNLKKPRLDTPPDHPFRRLELYLINREPPAVYVEDTLTDCWAIALNRGPTFLAAIAPISKRTYFQHLDSLLEYDDESFFPRVISFQRLERVRVLFDETENSEILMIEHFQGFTKKRDFYDIDQRKFVEKPDLGDFLQYYRD